MKTLLLSQIHSWRYTPQLLLSLHVLLKLIGTEGVYVRAPDVTCIEEHEIPAYLWHFTDNASTLRQIADLRNDWQRLANP